MSNVQISIQYILIFYISTSWVTVVKWSGLCYRTTVCWSICPVCNIGVFVPNGWMDLDEMWHGGRPWPRPHCITWGSSPEFLAHVRCGKMAGWTKMPLGMEVGLSPGDIVLDGDPAYLPQKGGHRSRPQFSAHVLWPNGWMDQDTTWYRGRPQPRRHYVKPWFHVKITYFKEF